MTGRDPWYDALYLRYSPLLLKAAVSMLGDRAVAEEIVQDVFAFLWISRGDVEAYTNPGSWLFKVLNNRIKNEMRRAKYRYEIPYDPEYHQPTTAGEPLKLEHVLPPGLTEQERQFLIWYYEEDLGHEEIAARLGCSVHASHMRLHRAREKCKKLLMKEKIFSNTG